MIYTVTMNPSLDYLLSLPALQTGETNRSAAERLVAGEKGSMYRRCYIIWERTASFGALQAAFSGEELCRQLTAAQDSDRS